MTNEQYIDTLSKTIKGITEAIIDFGDSGKHYRDLILELVSPNQVNNQRLMDLFNKYAEGGNGEDNE